MVITNPCLGYWLQQNAASQQALLTISIRANCLVTLNFSIPQSTQCLIVASCSDGIKNGNETGVDCGGNCAKKCAAGVSCASSSDCSSGLGCSSGICAAATTSSSSSKQLTVNDYGIIVAVLGAIILIVGVVCTFKCWIPAMGGDGAYMTAVSYTPATHEGIEMEPVKSDRGVSVVDDHLHQSPAHGGVAEDEMYVS